MKKTLFGSVAVGVALVTLACAQPPDDAVSAARNAVQAAESADAAEYAAASLSAAKSSLSGLEAELQAQGEKFALTRSYAKATELAAQVEQAASKAAADAAAGKAAARAEAESLVAAVKVGVEEVKVLLDAAPKGKGSVADIEAMRADVSTVEAGFGELDAALADGRFKAAKAAAETGQQTLDRIRADVQAAIDAKAAAGRR